MLLKISCLISFSLIGICVCDNYTVSDEEYARMPELFYLDDYDRCMLNKDKSQYCNFVYQLEPTNSENSSEVWKIVHKVSSDVRNFRHDLLRHYICLRESCPNALNKTDEALRREINKCYDEKFKSLGMKGTVSELKCISATFEYEKSILDYLVAVILISYIFFVIFASFYEGIARYKPKEEYEKVTGSGVGWFLSAFSITKNWYRLTASNTNPEVKRLQSLHGIRFYTMICVIMVHTLMCHFRGPILNPQYTEKVTKSFVNMLFINGTFVVQSFFVVTSWLLTYHFFQMFEKHKEVNMNFIVLAIFNRFIRLLPTVIVVIAIHCTWIVQMGSGPLWDELVADDYRNCKKNWWTNVLFINNLVHPEEQCIQQTWYLAADTQLFIFTICILTLVWKYKSKAKYIFGVCYLVGIAIPACIAYVNNYDIHNRQWPEQMYKLRNVKNPVWIIMYSATYNNIAGWMVGVTFGYLYYLYKDVQVFTKKIYVVLWWITIWSFCLTMVFSASFMYAEGYQYTRVQSALYWSLSKPIFALGIALAIFGFSQGIGWFMKWVLEWNAIEIYGRLSFTAYISHLIFIQYRVGVARQPVFAMDSLFIYYIFGDLCVSYIVATVFCLFIEMPISALQKVLVPQLSSQRAKDDAKQSVNGDANKKEFVKSIITNGDVKDAKKTR